VNLQNSIIHRKTVNERQTKTERKERKEGGKKERKQRERKKKEISLAPLGIDCYTNTLL
jgi:hypothetical protein